MVFFVVGSLKLSNYDVNLPNIHGRKIRQVGMKSFIAKRFNSIFDIFKVWTPLDNTKNYLSIDTYLIIYK